MQHGGTQLLCLRCCSVSMKQVIVIILLVTICVLQTSIPCATTRQVMQSFESLSQFSTDAFTLVKQGSSDLITSMPVSKHEHCLISTENSCILHYLCFVLSEC